MNISLMIFRNICFYESQSYFSRIIVFSHFEINAKIWNDGKRLIEIESITEIQ